ncbi:MAG: YciI family protein [Bacteroidota bacterium]
MKFFIVELRYIVPLETIQPYTDAHRAFLKTLYDQEILLLSGPAVPRTKGILIARHESGEELLQLLKNDPYSQNNLVETILTEFAPANYLPEVSQWLLKD